MTIICVYSHSTLQPRCRGKSHFPTHLIVPASWLMVPYLNATLCLDCSRTILCELLTVFCCCRQYRIATAPTTCRCVMCVLLSHAPALAMDPSGTCNVVNWLGAFRGRSTTSCCSWRLNQIGACFSLFFITAWHPQASEYTAPHSHSWSRWFLVWCQLWPRQVFAEPARTIATW